MNRKEMGVNRHMRRFMTMTVVTYTPTTQSAWSENCRMRFMPS